MKMEGMKKIIDLLEARSKEFNQKRLDCDKAIEGLQKVCQHPLIAPEGHDGHYNYEKCSECSKTFKA